MEDLSGQSRRWRDDRHKINCSLLVSSHKDVVVGQETNDKLRDACYASLHPSRLEGKAGYEMVEQTFLSVRSESKAWRSHRNV